MGQKSTVIAIAMLTICASSRLPAAAPPNIVLIVSDDQGYRDLGCFGSEEILTPNLDRVAASGVKLTNFYVAWPACTPSRGGLLTGRYPQRNGIYDMIRNEAPDYGYKYKPAEYDATFERIGGMDLREVLISDVLSDAGYKCGIFGKWDLGTLKRFLPTSRGFDDFYGFVNTGIDYFTHERYGVPSMYRDEEPTTADKGVYATELFRREAIRFVDVNHDQPFFLYLPFNAPHSASNLDSRIRSGAQSTAKYRAMYPHLEKDAAFVKKNYRYGGESEVRNPASRRLEYAAAVTEMDAAIGDVLDRIAEHGLQERTIVIFFSDNGGSGGADNSPLRGHKSQMWEGGVRVPCIVSIPGQTPAGMTCDEFLTSLEVVPTLLSQTSAKMPMNVAIDGFDMTEAVCGTASSPRESMFWKRRGDRACRIGNWKWVDATHGSGLFDLANDIGEKVDLSAERPEKAMEMQARFKDWLRTMDAAEPRGPFRDF